LPKREGVSLHEIQGVIDPAADRALHVIREIALQHAHATSLVISQNLSRQGALSALIDHLEVGGHEGRLAVPPVHLRVALVPEEERVAVVRAEDDEASRFWPDVVYSAVSGASAEMFRADEEHAAAAQVREDQTRAAVLAAHQRQVEHVSAIAVHEHGLWKNHAVSSTRGHIVHQDCPGRRVRHVDEDATVRTVICHDVLQSGRGTRQTGQVDGFHQLKNAFLALLSVTFHFHSICLFSRLSLEI